MRDYLKMLAILFAASFMAVSFAACSDDKEETPETPEEPEVVIDTTLPETLEEAKSLILGTWTGYSCDWKHISGGITYKDFVYYDVQEANNFSFYSNGSFVQTLITPPGGASNTTKAKGTWELVQDGNSFVLNLTFNIDTGDVYETHTLKALSATTLTLYQYEKYNKNEYMATTIFLK